MTSPHAVILGGRRLEFAVSHSRTARRARIRVSAAGVVVVLPRRADAARADRFLRANARWVLAQLKFIERAGSLRQERRTSDRPTVMLRGVHVPVRIEEEEASRTFGIVRHGAGEIIVRVPRGGGVDPMRALESWLRRTARADIHAAIESRARDVRRRPGKVMVMAQRTKWGNCSRRGNVSINWRLVMAPPAVLDYAVVHELAHLVVPSHSSRFWFVVMSHCPSYAKHRAWLTANGDRLRGWTRTIDPIPAQGLPVSV